MEFSLQKIMQMFLLCLAYLINGFWCFYCRILIRIYFERRPNEKLHNKLKTSINTDLFINRKTEKQKYEYCCCYVLLWCDQKLASDSSGLSGGFRGIGRGFGL
jgi:hypothetical protein